MSNVTEDTSPHVKSERQIPDTTLNPRFESGPSAGNSFDPKEGRFSKDDGPDQQRLRISEPHFDKFPTPTTFAYWKIRFKTEVCTCSQFPTEAKLCVKTTPQKTRFRSVNLSKEFAYRSKLSKWLQRQELKLTTRSTERNPTMCDVT